MGGEIVVVSNALSNYKISVIQQGKHEMSFPRNTISSLSESVRLCVIPYGYR